MFPNISSSFILKIYLSLYSYVFEKLFLKSCFYINYLKNKIENKYLLLQIIYNSKAITLKSDQFIALNQFIALYSNL